MRCYPLHKAIAFVGLWHISRAADPQPVQVPVSTDWLGYDGSWSPVNMRVGSPQQWVSLFPNTMSQETLVIGASGCDGTIACAWKRGGTFKSNESSTWSSIGSYLLDPQSALGVAGAADYGLDTVSIENVFSIPEQFVGVMNTTEFLLGSLGLGVISSNFTTSEQPTFLSRMVENQSAIPSHSFGYTAGAYYRLKGVPASLTLGGVDLNRFSPNDLSFDMATGYQPVVSINSITVSSNPLATSATKPNWTEEPLSLLGGSQAELFSVDSSTPFLWMPAKICDAFALALNLTYNETLQLYLYGNGTDPSTLADWNITFTFTIADLPGSSKAVDITLPYDAFNHNLTFPFPALNATVSSPPVSYFPLRKASNNTQYTIGRVFLQEAYLAVDYERNNFSISQANFANDAVTNVRLAGITRPPNSIFPGPAKRSTGALSTSAKAGLSVGIVVLAVIAVGLVVFFCRRRPPLLKGTPQSPNVKKGLFKGKPKNEAKAPTPEATELTGDKHQPLEVPADKTNSRFELPGSAPLEMPAEVPASYYALDKARYGTVPAELEHRESTWKNSRTSHTDQSSQSPSLPPYSPAQVGRRLDISASPNSTLFNASGPSSGTTSSGISGISPNDPSSNNLPYHNRYGLARGSSSAQAVTPPVSSPLLPLTPSDKPGSQPGSNLPNPREEHHAAPSRNVSRSSRFKEEGIGARPPQRPQPERRFSWEEER